MRAGPKGSLTAGPLDLGGLPLDGPPRVERFLAAHLYAPKGVGARGPVQAAALTKIDRGGAVPAPRTGPRPPTGLVSLPRGNDKSTLAAALAVYGLFADKHEGSQVLCVASSDLRQAGIVFNAARRMVELSPELARQCKVYAGDNHGSWFQRWTRR